MSRNRFVLLTGLAAAGALAAAVALRPRGGPGLVSSAPTRRPGSQPKPCSRPALAPVDPLPELEPAVKARLLELPLSRNFPPFREALTSHRERFDDRGVVMCDYTKYGQGWAYNPEAVARYGIRAVRSYLESGDAYYLALFKRQCDWLVSNLRRSRDGLWQWTYDFDYVVNDVYDLKGPWGSAMAQGTAMAALARGHALFGDARYLDAVTRAAASFSVDVDRGGFRRRVADDAWWYEEYPTRRPSYVLNGFVVAVLGLWESQRLLPADQGFDALVAKGVNALDRLLPQFIIKDETGRVWSRYDLTVKMPTVLLRFLPPRGAAQPVRISRIALTGGDELEVLDVGDASDASKDCSHLLHNPEFQTWGPREKSGDVTFRNAFAEAGRYRHAPFRMRLPPSRSGRAIDVTYDAAFKGHVIVQVHDGSKYVSLGSLEGRESGRGPCWVPVSLPVPAEVLDKVRRRAGTDYNIAKAYHDDHVILLCLLDRSLGLRGRYAPVVNLWLDALIDQKDKRNCYLLEELTKPRRRPPWMVGFPLLTEVEPAYREPAYLPKSAWHRGFARRFVLANPPAINEQIWRRQSAGGQAFRRAYAGTLRMWLVQDLANLDGPALGEALKRRVQASFEANLPALKRQAPGAGRDVLLMCHIMQLVHGHYAFATTAGAPKNAGALLRLPTGDCSEFGRAGAVLARLFRADARILSFKASYTSELGPFEAGHCVFAAADCIFDPSVNLSIRASWRELKDKPSPDRFETLLKDGRLHLLYNRFLEPQERRMQIVERSTDGGVMAFFYPWYCRGFGTGRSAFYPLPVPDNLRFVAKATTRKDIQP